MRQIKWIISPFDKALAKVCYNVLSNGEIIRLICRVNDRAIKYQVVYISQATTCGSGFEQAVLIPVCLCRQAVNFIPAKGGDACCWESKRGRSV